MPSSHHSTNSAPPPLTAKLGKTPVRAGALTFCLFGQDLIWVCRSGCGCNEKIKNPSPEGGGLGGGREDGEVSKERNG